MSINDVYKIKWALFFLVFFHDFGNLQHSSLGPQKIKKGAKQTKKNWFSISEKTKKEGCFRYGHYVMSITK